MTRARFVFATAALVASLLAAPSALAYTTADIASLALANVGDGACTNSQGGAAYGSSCTGNGGQPEYWCADFAKWVWENTGVGDTSSLTAAAGSFYVYGQNHGTLSNTPAVGDAVVFNYAGNGYADHVALVSKVNADGTIETVSGDWGGQSGTEAQFASTSSVVLNTPAYPGVVGSAPGVMGMTISGFIAPVGVTAGPPPVDASFVGQGSDAAKDPTGKAFFQVCTGQAFHFWFEVKNTGADAWTDTNDTRAGDWGKAVRLGVPGDKPDVFTGTSRISINEADSTSVDPGKTTRFVGGAGIAGTAPSKPGVYKTTWQLVDELRSWFGPEMWLSFDVVACATTGGEDGGAGAGPTPSNDGGSPTAPGATPGAPREANAGSVESAESGSSDGGCSLGSGSSRGYAFPAASLIGLALLVVRRRRHLAT